MKRLIPLLAVFAVIPFTGCPLSSDPPASIRDAPDQNAAPIGQLVEKVLSDNLANRTLAAPTHGAWQILHGVLAYGDQFTLQTDDGSDVPAVEYMLAGGAVNGFEPTRGDQLGSPPRAGLRMEMQPSTKIGQGHRDQWLAVMVQSGLAEDSTIVSPAGTFTIGDWVRQTEHDIYKNLEHEFSWTLIALTAFQKTSRQWYGGDGERYSVESLLQSELSKDLVQSSCGGTHRLIGISMTLNKRRAEGAPITGVWLEAETMLDDNVRLAQQNQNPDGSYSVAYLHRPGWTRDLGETLGTTGHVLEFLAIAASDDTLQQPWVERSVRRLCDVLVSCQDVDLECGVLYHALHGLAVYQNRMNKIAKSQM